MTRLSRLLSMGKDMENWNDAKPFIYTMYLHSTFYIYYTDRFTALSISLSTFYLCIVFCQLLINDVGSHRICSLTFTKNTTSLLVVTNCRTYFGIVCFSFSFSIELLLIRHLVSRARYVCSIIFSDTKKTC